MTDLDASTIDITGLKSFYGSDQAAKAILDDFAGRQRNRGVTKVDQLLDRMNSQGFNRSDVIRVLRKLEELGFGDFVEGRRGHPSRFEWRYELVAVGKAASGDLQHLQEVSDVDEEDEDIEHVPDVPSGSIAHKFQLRPDRQVELILPVDLTTREANRLSEFIKTLPFDVAQA